MGHGPSKENCVGHRLMLSPSTRWTLGHGPTGWTAQTAQDSAPSSSAPSLWESAFRCVNSVDTGPRTYQVDSANGPRLGSVIKCSIPLGVSFPLRQVRWGFRRLIPLLLTPCCCQGVAKERICHPCCDAGPDPLAEGPLAEGYRCRWHTLELDIASRWQRHRQGCFVFLAAWSNVARRWFHVRPKVEFRKSKKRWSTESQAGEARCGRVTSGRGQRWSWWRLRKAATRPPAKSTSSGSKKPAARQLGTSR